MALATLSIDLEAKFAQLQQGMDAAARLVVKNSTDMRSSLNDLGKASTLVSGIVKGSFAGLGVAGLVAGFRAVLDGVDALNDLKDATGASIENLSALEDIGARTGTAFDSVAAIVVKFNKVLADAKPGSEAANVLKSIGLSAQELQRLDPAQALQRTAIALQGFADDGNKARIVQELFGKSVQEAAPFLKDLAEAGKLVGTVTTQQAEEAEKFNKQLFDLQKNTVDLARDLTSKLLPALNAIFEGRRTGGVKGALDALGEQIGLGAAFHENRRIEQLNARLKELRATAEQGGGFSLFGTSDNAVEEEIAAKQRELDDIYRAFRERNRVESKGFAATAASFGGGNQRPSLPATPPGATTAATARQSELERYIEALEKAQLAVLDLTKLEEVELEIASGKFKDLTPKAAEYLRVLARGIDLAKQPADFIGPGIDPAILQQRADAQRELNKLLEDSGEGRFNGLVDLTNNLVDAHREGSVTAEQYASAMAVLQKRFEDLNPKLTAVQAEMDEFTRRAAGNIQDVLGDNIASTLKGDFDDIEQRWKDMLINMVAQAGAAKLAQVLFGDFGKTGSVGGLFGQLIGLGGGGAGVDGTAASGGLTVGGIGAEGVVGLGAGRATAQGVRSNVVHINQTNTFGAGVGRGEVQAAMAENNRALLAGLRAEGKL